jgi:hypothetical protein
MTQTYRSRWGYHPCDYETYGALKKLNALYLRAVRELAAWRRWSRKQPQNRMRRQKVVDSQGRQVGWETAGPWPQPCLCPVFCQREKVIRHWSPGTSRASREVELVGLRHSWIPDAYRAARTPAASPEQVVPLPITAEEIGGLLEQSEGGG